MFCIVMWLAAAACVAGDVLSRRDQPLMLLSEREWFGLTGGLRLDNGKAYVSWRPRTPHRPAWAGQVNRLGFRYTRWSNGSAEVGVPLVAVALAATLVAAACTALEIKRRRAPAGKCLVCGYDLRATPGLCPECGAVPPTAKASD
jgi:hypothetical protein